MNSLSYLQLKFPMKLKLKDTTHIKTYAPQSEHLKVQCKPEIPEDKYPVSLKTGNGATVGHLQKRNILLFTKSL